MDALNGHEPKIAELGHVGLRCHDVQTQLAFYTEVLGLEITDHDEELEIWFLSARPDDEHHELLLTGGRTVGADAALIQQVSFRCNDFADVRGFHRRLVASGADLDMVVSHGNAVGVYFFDPEGNRCEVYWQTGLEARQPFVQHIDIETDLTDLFESIRQSTEEFGATGYTEPAYREKTKQGTAQRAVGQGRT